MQVLNIYEWWLIVSASVVVIIVIYDWIKGNDKKDQELLEKCEKLYDN